MYLGDFDFGSTVFFTFTTVTSSGGVTAFSSGGVTVYRQAVTGESASGLTLTSTFDTRTGLNHVQIDMSTAGFYSSAGDFMAIVSSGAANSEDLSGYTVAQWSILSRSPLTSTAGLETLSSAGLETLSSAGLETATGFSTHSTAGLETVSTAGLETVSTAGLETATGFSTHSTAGLETATGFSTHSTAGLETATGFSTHASSDAAASVWNSTRANFTAAGSFGQIVSTSTAAPDQYVAGPFSTHSTAGLETLSTDGLETLSTAGIETVSTAGLETATGFSTHSTAGLETATGFSTHASSDTGASVWNSTRANFTAVGSFGEMVSTSTAAPDQWVAAAVTGSTNVNVLEWGGSTVEGMPLDSTAGLETVSTAGIETISSAVVVASASSAIEAANLDHLLIAEGSSDHVTDGSLWSRITSSSTFYGDFVPGEDSLASIRSRGDVAWLTGAGSNSSDISAAVWNATRADFTAAGSFGQLVSTSTAAPDQWVAAAVTGSSLVDVREWGGSTVEGMPLDSTAGLETVSTAGLETATGFSTHSTAGLETATGFSTHSTAGLETLSSAGLETATGFSTHSTAGLETATGFSTHASSDAAASVWNSTRSSFTAAGSFGQIVSTSTAAPDQWVAGPFSTHSTAGLETLSTAGLETATGFSTHSTAGLETATGFSTHSTAGLETVSTSGLETATGFSTHSTAGLETATGFSTHSTAGLETATGFSTHSTAGLETVSTAGLETVTGSAINAEVVDAITTDTYEEPSFGVPSTAQSLTGMGRYLYSALRNQLTVSSSAKVFYGAAENVLFAKALSQDSTGSTGVYLESEATTST